MTQFTSTYINGTIDEITLASGSIYFNGSQSVTTTANAAFAFGTSDFTIEAWIYPTASTGYNTIFTTRGSDPSSIWFGLDNNTLVPIIYTGGYILTSPTAVTLNAWTHIAVVRISNVVKVYINGVSVSSGSSYTTNLTQTACSIGYDTAYTGNPFYGYISNVRVINGRGIYTQNFGTIQGPIPNVANTSLLLSVQPSVPFKDSSTNNFTMSTSGTPTFTNVGPFNPAPPAAGTSQNIPMRQFRDGTIMISGIYDEVGAGLSYVAGLYKSTYVGYFNSVPTWFATATTGTYGANPATSVQTTIIEEPSSDDGSLFSVQWLGYFLPSTTETYTFYTSSDDASFVWVGDYAVSGFTTTNAIVQNGGDHGTQERSGTIALTAGTYYPIRIQFGENGGGDNMSFNYSTPTITKTTNVTGKVFYNSATNGI